MQTHALGAPQARVCTIWETYKLSISTYVSAHLQVYGMHFADANGRPYLSSGGRVSKGAPILVGCTDEIEELRPKSPPPGGDRN